MIHVYGSLLPDCSINVDLSLFFPACPPCPTIELMQSSEIWT